MQPRARWARFFRAHLPLGRVTRGSSDDGDRADRYNAAVPALFTAVALALSLGQMAPTFAGTTTVPVADRNLVSVGTNGSSTDYADIAVSQGGCANSAAVAVAVGDSWCGYEASGVVAVGLLGADSRATDFCPGLPFGLCVPAEVALSDTGDARDGMYNATVSGSASGDRVFQYYGTWPTTSISATGPASGSRAVSGTGHAHGFTAVSGGSASSPGGGHAIAATGDAYATPGWYMCSDYTPDDCWLMQGTCESPTYVTESGDWADWPNTNMARGHVAASGTRNATGCIAVAPLGHADGGTAAVGGSGARGSLAVSPLGSATAANYGGGESAAVGLGTSSIDSGPVCVSVTGNCYGGLASVSPLGYADSRSYEWRYYIPTGGERSQELPSLGLGAQGASGRTAAVGGGNSYSNGVACVSATGSCSGGAALGVAPLGSSNR